MKLPRVNGSKAVPEENQSMRPLKNLLLVLALQLPFALLSGQAAAQDLSQPNVGLPATGLPATGLPATGLPATDLVQPEQEFLRVEEAYRLAVEVVDEQQLRLYWQIEGGYYLYQKRFKFKLETADGPIELTPS